MTVATAWLFLFQLVKASKKICHNNIIDALTVTLSLHYLTKSSPGIRIERKSN